MTDAPSLLARLRQTPALGMLLVALAYFVTGKLGLLLAIPPGYATALWPPSGIALAALLLLGRRIWPGVLLGSALTNLATSFDQSSAGALAQSIALSMGIGTGAALQAWVGTALVRRFAGRAEVLLRSEREVALFFALAGPTACLINASWSVTLLYATGAIPRDAVAYSWWTWWAGDSIGVLIFAPLLLMWCGEDATWRARRVPITLSLAAMQCAAVLVFIYSSNAEWADMKKEFERDATHFASSLERRLALDAENLRSTSSLFALDRKVTAEDFMIFTEPMLVTHPELMSLGWAPVVPASDRAVFEAQELPGTARSGIWEIRHGERIAAAAREQYVPLLYSQSRRKVSLVGLDLAAFPGVKQAFDTARATGQATSITPVSFRDQTARTEGFMMIRPIYDRPDDHSGDHSGDHPGDRRAVPDADHGQQLLGFVYAAMHVSGLLAGDGRELADRRMHLTIRDPDARADHAVLYRSLSSSEDRHERAELTSEVAITVANRSWVLAFTATEDYGAGEHATVAWLVLAGGMVLSALVGGGALILTGRTTLVESLVRERTEELAQINGKLAEEICDHVRTEYELDSEKQFLSTVLENLNEGILVYDLDGHITIENRAAKRIRVRITGSRVERRNWTGYTLFAADGVTELAFDELPHTRAMRGETLHDLQIIAVSKGRAPVTLTINAHPLRDRNGEQNGSITVIHDITDVQKAERIKREFVSVVSHELRTPLTSIRGSLGLVNGGIAGELPPKARKLIEIAYRNTDRLSMLINDILDMERIETGGLTLTTQACAVRDLLQQAVEAHQGYAEECQVHLALLDPQVDATVHVDASRFQQVMANLLSNATKFSPAGAVVEIGATLTAGEVRIFVRDRGPGIPPEFRPLMFKKFSQVDGSDTRAKPGTGLGLAISKGLIEKMQGRIDYETQANVGSTFFFDLPVQPANLPAPGTESFTDTGSVLVRQKSA